MTARHVLAAELADAIESHDVAWSVYLATPEYSDAEDRATRHLESCTAAVAIARQRLDMHDRRRTDRTRWSA